MAELLAPAGDFGKLKTAVAFGADAVYLGARDYSLRSASGNFDFDELAAAVDYAHSFNVKVYVAVNVFARNEDVKRLPVFFTRLGQCGADAAIISDPGALELCREYAPGLDIHISTQANVTNSRSAAFWHKLGAKRVILARELSLAEIAEMRADAPASLELEMFVHGAMCVSYSGRCLLSAYMTGRDSNRGACAHPCRYEYALVEAKRPGEFWPIEEDSRGAYIMNSRDLRLIGHLPEILAAGVTSLKIEGRVKSRHYVASTVSAYRRAIDDLTICPDRYKTNLPKYLTELDKASHRPYGTGFALPGAQGEQVYDSANRVGESEFLGIVTEFSHGWATVEQRGKFCLGEGVEFLRSGGEPFSQTLAEMTDADGVALVSAPHARQTIRIRVEGTLSQLDIMRRAQ